jgi:hypothetical protein
VHAWGALRACGRSAARRGREIEEEQGTQHGGAPAVIRSAPLAVAASSPRSSTFCSLGVGAVRAALCLGWKPRKQAWAPAAAAARVDRLPPARALVTARASSLFCFSSQDFLQRDTVLPGQGRDQGEPGKGNGTMMGFFFTAVTDLTDPERSRLT